MADLLGPANASGAVTVRPNDARIFGNDDTFFVGCSEPGADDGTEIQAEFLNAILGQIRSAIRGMGAGIDNASDDMLLNAIKLARLRYAVDAGAADALAVTLSPPIPSYATELTLLVKVAATNATATPTINVDGKGAKAIKGADGGALAAGDLPIGHVVMLTYDGTDFRLIARWQAPGGGSPSIYQPGDLIFTFNDSAPLGTLECNGAAVSRTTYATLFAKYGVKYGAGDGTTTFNLPDARGEFLRCWDHGAGRDPDAAARTARADGQGGDKVGTKQGEQFKSHSHSGSTQTAGILLVSHPMGGGFEASGNNPSFFPENASLSLTTNNAGGNETRPRNMNVLCCVAY